MGYGQQEDEHLYDPSMVSNLSGLPAMNDASRMPASGADAGSAMSPNVAAAGVLAGAGLAKTLAEQANARQMAKVQNELIRRKNLQSSIEQGTMGIEQANNQNTQNLARAFLR